MSAKHTPGPWMIGAGYNDATPGHVCAGRRLIAACRGYVNNRDPNTGDENDANAEHIVRCVNACEGINPKAVPAMLQALELSLVAINASIDIEGTYTAGRREVGAAISKAIAQAKEEA